MWNTVHSGVKHNRFSSTLHLYWQWASVNYHIKLYIYVLAPELCLIWCWRLLSGPNLKLYGYNCHTMLQSFSYCFAIVQCFSHCWYCGYSDFCHDFMWAVHAPFYAPFVKALENLALTLHGNHDLVLMTLTLCLWHWTLCLWPWSSVYDLDLFRCPSNYWIRWNLAESIQVWASDHWNQ